MGFTPEQIKGRIKSVAKQNNADARTLMRIYMMERFLERLAQSEYRDNFIIKGGILVTAMIGVAHRSTMDIDTSMKNLNLSAEDAYFHGHTVGGTNPSLIEALGSTDLNLLVDVGFNKEVAEDCALYWSRKPGSLAKLIDKADQMSADEITEMGRKAKKRVAEEYTWDKICGQYEDVFTNREN